MPPRRQLNDWLRGYLDFTENTECPTGFNFWVGVWTIAGALRRRVWIDMGHFQWYPNFYLFLVAPPGVVSKSTALNIGTNLLRSISGINFGPEAMTWQALVQALAAAHEEVPIEPPGEDMLFYPMSCLSIAAGELGTLISPQNRELMDALVSLWDGKQGAWEKWTKTSGSDSIINPWLNIASCTTPSWIAQNFPEELVGGGFTSRCVFVYAEKKRQLIAYPRLTQREDQLELQNKLLHDLEQISTLAGPFIMSPAAIEFGQEWYTAHHAKAHNILTNKIDSERFGGYLARKQTHIHKIAMVLSAAKGDTLVIEPADLQAALALIESIEPQMAKVFESIGVEGAGRHLHFILAVLRAFRKVPRDELFARVCRRMSMDEFDAAIGAGARGNLFTVSGNGNEQIVTLVATEGVDHELSYEALSNSS
jgi:hypothetical protein